MRWPASPNACAEAPRLLTLGAGGGLGGGGRGWEVAQGGRQALPSGIDGSGAFVGAGLGSFGAFIGAPGAVVRPRDCRVGAFLVGALGVAGLGDALGGPFGGFVSSAFCPGGLFGRDGGRCPRLGARLTCLLRCGLGAPQGFVRRRNRRASVDEGTAVADTRSAARRAASALLARGSGRRGSGPWSSEVVLVVGLPARSHTAASRCPSDPAWGSLVKTLAARWYRLTCVQNLCDLS